MDQCTNRDETFSYVDAKRSLVGSGRWADVSGGHGCCGGVESDPGGVICIQMVGFSCS